MLDPPLEVSSGGTANVLKYLSQGEAVWAKNPVIKEKEEDPLFKKTPGFREFRGFHEEQDSRKRDLLKNIQEEESSQQLMAFQQQQDRQRQDLLKIIQEEQCEADAIVKELQKAKDSKRTRLIAQIQQEEEESKFVLKNILCLKNGPDSVLLEQEQYEQEKLLKQIVNHHVQLRRQEIIAQMTGILDEELEKIEMYQRERNATSQSILEDEYRTNSLLQDILLSNDKQRETILQQIAVDDELQKSAFASLITKNDSRSWGLIEQIRILENELGKLTNLEIEKKKLCMNEQVNDLANRRVEIAYVLTELMCQQDKRRVELAETLQKMEETKASPDFWLLQYQKLLDQQPVELSSSVIDPSLGYEFLKLGVIHCLPFLSKIWQDSQFQIENVTEANLIQVGVHNTDDRINILAAISNYLSPAASAPRPSGAESPSLNSECVVCMDAEARMVFVPCGHLCCCSQCQSAINECPMCRTQIEKRIRVIET